MSNVKQRNSIGDRTGPKVGKEANYYDEYGIPHFLYDTWEDNTVALLINPSSSTEFVEIPEGHYLINGENAIINYEGDLFHAYERKSKILQPFMKQVFMGDDGLYYEAIDFLDPEKTPTIGPFMVPLTKERVAEGNFQMCAKFGEGETWLS